MLMLFLSILFSIVSTGMMSYLAMTTQLGPWVAPVFVVVSMVLMMPFFDARWFKKHVVITIAAGSVGGMVGICLGLSIPSFYFLHHHLFIRWLSTPWIFILIISGFVLCAAAFALLIATTIKDRVLAKSTARFPMVQLVHNVIFIETQKMAQVFMLMGISFASMWNIVMLFARSALSPMIVQMSVMPMLLSVGFVAGIVIAPPVLLGLATRVFFIETLHQYIVTTISSHVFLITFASGMLITWLCQFAIKMLLFQKLKAMFSYNFWTQKVDNMRWYAYSLLILCAVILLLSLWGATLIAQWYVIAMIVLLSWYLVQIVAEVGVVEVDSYVWFIVLPLIYFASLSSLTIVAIAVFATLCLGLVIDCLFSYKLAKLSNIEFASVFKYQIISAVVSAFSVGVFFWWYSKTFEVDSFSLFVSRAHELDDIIQFGRYDYRVLLCGFVYGWLVRLFTAELLIVIGAVLMMPSVAIWLVIAGAFAYVVPEREKYYPIWFGVYAGHSLWLIVRAFY